MKTVPDLLLPVLGALGLVLTGSAGTLYVDINNPAPAVPYTNWSMAATNIQDAVDAAVNGDEILVTNGVYSTGSRAVNGTLPNRLAINRAVVVRSVTGPYFTWIVGQGAGVTGTELGQGAIRCVYVGTNAVLSGFTLTNGHTQISSGTDSTGGGAWCEPSGVVTNCALTGNGAYDAGGAYYGTLNNCTLARNSAHQGGGGALGGTLNNCTLIGNSAYYGGGVYGATLNDCALTGNSAEGYGGGDYDSTLSNCTLIDNSASFGGGAYYGRLNNSTLTGNLAGSDAGGVFYATLNNCTLTGNSARGYGGGAYHGTLNNCIVYHNMAPIGANYDDSSTFSYSCTAPLPPGLGNIDLDPVLVSATHLSAQSPCIGRGSTGYAHGVDIDGEAWLNPPCMGADQFIAGAAIDLTVAIEAAYTNVANGFAVSFVAQNTGPITASVWDFGDGVVVTNRPYISHAWAAPGIYPVRLTGYNDSWPGGVITTVLVQVAAQELYYVDGANPTPAFPYTNWAGAATNIQEAIDAGAQIGRLVRVTNGVYAMGGMTNRVVVAEGVAVRSENGPLVTFIVGQPSATPFGGYGAVRCAYVGTNAVLSGFTLTNGHTQTSGGGAWCEPSGVLTNCTLTGNSASSEGGGAYRGTLNNCILIGNSAFYGGGANGGTLNDCTLIGNSAGGYGGGAYYGTLSNCTLTGNSAGNTINSFGYGGGAYYGTLNNCTLTGNSATNSGGGAHGGTLNNCTFTDNSARFGGGALSGTLNNCILIGNSAGNDGGGAYFNTTLNNCTLTGNSAGDSGGGAYSATLNNCTLTGNSARGYGGGASHGALNNCVVYFNTAPFEANYDDSSTFAYSCTTPLPSGPGNIDLDPMLVSATHLSAQSPCIGRGSTGYAHGVDIDGEAWLNPPCIGADQFIAGAAIDLTVAIEAAYTNVANGFAVSFVAQNTGPITASVWDFGDGVVVTNRPYTSHAWAAPGIYRVRLTGYNDSWPGGVSTTVLVQVATQEVYYVNAANPMFAFPYTSWAEAATNIQDAIDAGTQIGRLVRVTDGIYTIGGRAVFGAALTNRVVVAEGVAVRSENGPLVSFIVGQPGTTVNLDNAIRCVYVGANAVLSGFTLTNGHTRIGGDYYKGESGGGAWCEPSGVVTNCTLTGNSAQSSGGGAYSGTLNNCILAENVAHDGGGAYYGTLNNCTLTGNSVYGDGGGAYSGALNNCTVTGNTAGSTGGGAAGGTMSNCTLTGNSAYSGGGASYATLNNCTLADNLGSEDGGGAFNSTLSNCTLTGDSTGRYGGGASGGTLNNCILTGNSAFAGGGEYSGTLSNCTLIDNSAPYGGGAYYGTLNNCTLVGNLASSDGGAAYYGTLNNCIVYYNTAPTGSNYSFATFAYSCTTPLPSGPGNIANVPLFMDTNGWSNLRLQSNSPCINAGNNAFAPGTTDLDGNPRIRGGLVDMGTYEFQSPAPASVLPYWWLQAYGLPTDGSADYIDSDGDGLNNWQEWRCQTDPTNSQSALRLRQPARQMDNVLVTWESVVGVPYVVEYSTNLSFSPIFQALTPTIYAAANITAIADTNAALLPSRFYRVRVVDP